MNVLKKKAAQGCGWAVQWQWLQVKLRKVVHGVLFGVDSSTSMVCETHDEDDFEQPRTKTNVCGKGSSIARI